ncbi:non-specific lipid-transfer protein [Acinetobacter baumannii]
MAKSMYVVALAVIMVVVAFTPPQTTEAAIACNTVANLLTPCIDYVLNGGAVPPLNCCNGAKSLYNQAKTTPDRQAICNCLKSVAGQATPKIINNAAALPGKCGISIPYKISPSTDCSKVR